ncbi:Clathrin coat assembly protein [Smittium mucronatum]|uniref:Clathrin coat assembly protein n=1 Tax=Smittium mucronatum TaxID=133383 RepID=A0A1R0H7X7_9FUNG|nr:Clathrin coat assembly protein [Smittium mucronatum]
MHEGNGPAIYEYVTQMPSVLDLSKFRDKSGTLGVEQSRNIKLYASYLRDKSFAFKTVNIDFVLQKRNKNSQIYSKTISDPKLLLVELTTVQKQLHSLLKCQFEPESLNNEVTFSMFRYCLRDMLKLFQTMNEGAIKTLSIFFDLPEVDMSRALDLYKRFVKLVERTNEYLEESRRFEPLLGFTIPELLHAPTTLVGTLEEHLKLNDKEKAIASKEIKEYKRKTINGAAMLKQASSSGTTGVSMKKQNSGLNATGSILQKRKPLSNIKYSPEPNSAAPPVPNRPSANSSSPPSNIQNNSNNQSTDNLIDFFSNIDDSINHTSPTNNYSNNQATFAPNNNYLNNPDQMNFTVNLLQDRNSKYFVDAQNDINPMIQNTVSNTMSTAVSNPNYQTPATINSNNPYSNMPAFSSQNSSLQQQVSHNTPFQQQIVQNTPFQQQITQNTQFQQQTTPNTPFQQQTTQIAPFLPQSSQNTSLQQSSQNSFSALSSNTPFNQAPMQQFNSQSSQLSSQTGFTNSNSMNSGTALASSGFSFNPVMASPAADTSFGAHSSIGVNNPFKNQQTQQQIQQPTQYSSMNSGITNNQPIDMFGNNPSLFQSNPQPQMSDLNSVMGSMQISSSNPFSGANIAPSNSQASISSNPFALQSSSYSGGNPNSNSPFGALNTATSSQNMNFTQVSATGTQGSAGANANFANFQLFN